MVYSLRFFSPCVTQQDFKNTRIKKTYKYNGMPQQIIQDFFKEMLQEMNPLDFFLKKKFGNTIGEVKELGVTTHDEEKT